MQQNYQEFLIPARIVKEDKQTMTILVAKNDQYEFKLSRDKKRNLNRFFTIAFIKNKEGNMEMYKPWEHNLKEQK